MLNELAAEYSAHIKAGRTSEAANCQREAVLIAGARECPGWAAPAIPEIGFDGYDVQAVRLDVDAHNQMYRDARRAGAFALDHRHNRDEAKMRLAAMTE